MRDATKPLSKSLAYLSVALDADDRKKITVSGYAVMWGWSRGKVSRYLNEIGVSVCYPEETSSRQNQRGQIVIHPPDRSRADGDQIKLFVFGALREEEASTNADDEQLPGKSQDTTDHTHTGDTNKNTTPVPEEGKNKLSENAEADDVEVYIRLAVKHRKPESPIGYAKSIRRRLEKQGGMHAEDYEQLLLWKKHEDEAKVKTEILREIEEADRKLAEAAEVNYDQIRNDMPDDLRSAIDSARQSRNHRRLRVVK